MKLRVKGVFIFLFSLGFCLISTLVCSQTKYDGSIDEKAYKILDKAIGDVFTSQNIGIYFEGIAFGIKKPEEIFTLPVYKVFRGGYLFVKDDKFEIELGLMKTICDGNVMVVVDEQSKTMLIDSVRNKELEIKYEELESLVGKDFKDGTLVYNGIVAVNNVKCHKITSVVKNNSSSVDITYWVDVATENLYLMAENQNASYNVYWFNKVGKAPLNHTYQFFLSKKTMTSFQGYSVIDNRFTQVK